MPDNPYPLGLREYQSDFAPGPFDNISLTRRPGAIALDYQTCFTLGPKAHTDISEGITSRAWKIRYDADTLSFFGAPSNAANTAWESEVFFFTHTGGAFDEVDAAFDQQGHIAICGQRTGHVWVYYFDGTLGHYTFTDFGAGRTPKVVLDNPLDTSSSDILIFYIDDAADKIVYLQQRDRYLVKYDTPVTGVADSYIEDAIRSTDYRVHVYYTTRHDVTGKYSIAHIESTIYPVPASMESATGYIDVLNNGVLIDLLHFHVLFDIDKGQGFLEMAGGGELYVALVTGLANLDDYGTASLELGDGILDVPTPPSILTHTLYDKDSAKGTLDFGTPNSLFVALISHTLFDINQATASLTLGTGGTLAP